MIRSQGSPAVLRSSAVALALVALVHTMTAFGETPEELMNAGHFKRAKVIVCSERRPAVNAALDAYEQSRIHLAFGNLDAALKQAERAVELDNRNPKYHFQLASVLGPSAQKAGIFKKVGLARRMKEELEITLRLDQHNVEARFFLMMFYLKAPGIAGGDKDKAHSLAGEILAIDAARGYLAQAQIAREEKAIQKLEALYRKAVDADPKSYAAQVALASYYASEKKYALEEEHAQLALAIDGSKAPAHARLAEALAATQPPETVDAALAKAESNVPDNLVPYFAAGVSLFTQQRDLPRAERYLRKYLTQDPEGSAPSHALARWRLAQVLESLGRKPEAVAQLETAVRAEPDFEKAREELKRLK